ncbi:hypothetical protein ACLB1E_01430 [Escherichia coli]
MAGQRLFSDAVRQNVEHTEPYILPANCPALYSSSEAVQAFDAQYFVSANGLFEL